MALKKVTGPASTGAAAAPAAGGNFVKIFRKETFVRGGGIPAGQYCLMFQTALKYDMDKATGNAKGDPKLGVTISAYLLSDPTAEPKTHHYSMGRNAHKSFMPDPTGVGIVPIAGAPSGQMYRDTAWDFFLNKFIEAGLPEDLVDGSTVTPYQGVWVNIFPVAEPASWSTMQALGSTAEVGGKPREPGTISVVTEILPKGAPWEGGGGLPKTAIMAGSAKAVAPVKQAVATVAAVAPPAGDDTEAELVAAARDAITKVLETTGNESGLPKTKCRMDAINFLTAEFDGDGVAAIVATVFDDAAKYQQILAELGFKINGLRVVPVA